MFFELAIYQLSRPAALITFITPKFYLLNKDDEEMRRAFLNKLHIRSLAACNPFETAVTENVITIVDSGSPEKESIPAYKYNRDKGRFEPLFPINVRYCKSNQLSEIIMDMNPRDLTLLSKMRGNHRLLADYTISKRGAEVSKKVLRATDKGHKALIGLDVKKYRICWAGTYLSKNDNEYARLSTYFEKPMIYLRRVDSCLEAAYSDSGYAFNKNIYGITLKGDSQVSMEYILAILNSNAADYYYKKRFTLKKEEAFPEIQTYLYEQLPIPTPESSLQNKIETLVHEILSEVEEAKYEELIQEINIQVYNVFGLSDEEISFIENSR